MNKVHMTDKSMKWKMTKLSRIVKLSVLTVFTTLSMNLYAADDLCPPALCVSTDPDNPCEPEPSASSCGTLAPSTGCDAASVRCIGLGEEYSTSGSNIQQAFQSAIDDAKPGDTLLIRGGTYTHSLSSSISSTFMDVTVSGTSSSPITIKPYNNEKVVIKGFGFSEGTTLPSNTDQRLIRVSGDYIHIYDLELAESTRYGLEINGSYGVYENLTVRDSWNVNIAIGLLARNPVEGNLLRYIESMRSRHDSGIKMGTSSYATASDLVKNNRIETVLLHDNGYQPNGVKVPAISGDPAGGGNSDGVDGFKTCQDDASKFGLDNLCPGNVIIDSVAYHNADDGFDISWGSGSKLIDNIAFDNGPEGARGFKMLRYSKGGMSYIGNVAIGNFGPTGGFQGFGFELRFDGEGDVFHNSAISQNIGSIDRGLQINAQNITSKANLPVVNNLGAYNSVADIVVPSGADDISNWAEDSEGSPKVASSSYGTSSINTTFPSGLTIAQKVAYIQDQVRGSLTPDSGSPLIDAGTFIPGVHCATADDDPSSPMPAGADCRHWKGSAPDIGAYER